MATNKNKVTLQYLCIDHIKKIMHLELKPEGHHILLKGKNERGKTTFLNCIKQAFGIMELSDDMVTRGHEEGRIIAVYKDANGEAMKVERIIKNKKDACSITLRPASGGKLVPKPLTVLRAAAGVYIDVFEITEREKTAKGQRDNEEMFLKLANLNLDKIKKWNDDIAKAEDERLIIGRNRDDASGFVDTIRDTIDVEKYKEKIETAPIIEAHQTLVNSKLRNSTVEATELAEQYKAKLQDKNKLSLELSELKNKDLERVNVVQQLNAIKEKALASKNRIDQLKAELAEEEKNFEKWNDQAAKGEIKIKEYDDIPHQIEELNKKIEGIQEHNVKIMQEQSKAVTDLIHEVKTANDIVQAEARLELDQKLKDIEEHNKNVETVAEYKRKVEEHKQLEEEWKLKQEKIEEMRLERKNYVRSGSFPVPGLKYDEDRQRITYFENTLSEAALSYGQMIELGVKMSLAYNNNGGLGAICIPNASLLDKEKRTAVMEMLEANDMCGFFEIVEDDMEELTVEILKDGEDVA